MSSVSEKLNFTLALSFASPMTSNPSVSVPLLGRSPASKYTLPPSYSSRISSRNAACNCTFSPPLSIFTEVISVASISSPEQAAKETTHAISAIAGMIFVVIFFKSISFTSQIIFLGFSTLLQFAGLLPKCDTSTHTQLCPQHSQAQRAPQDHRRKR